MGKTPEETVDILDKRIARWKPPTVWEAANQRTLKYLKRIRTKVENGIKVKENARKRQEIRKRRNAPVIDGTGGT